MIGIVYNAQTGEESLVELPDVEVAPIEQEQQKPPLEERVAALEETVSEIVVKI